MKDMDILQNMWGTRTKYTRGFVKEEYASFDEYPLDQIKDAIENI